MTTPKTVKIEEKKSPLVEYSEGEQQDIIYEISQKNSKISLNEDAVNSAGLQKSNPLGANSSVVNRQQ
jgi:hypothetical protein